MIGNNFALDTNILIAWLRGEEGIANRIDKANNVFIPVIVIGELFYGASNAPKRSKHTAEINQLMAHYNILALEEDIAVLYGQIKTQLRKKGKPIPENDIWIAATAMHHQLSLITRDKHFTSIEGLTIIKW